MQMRRGYGRRTVAKPDDRNVVAAGLERGSARKLDSKPRPGCRRCGTRCGIYEGRAL